MEVHVNVAARAANRLGSPGWVRCCAFPDEGVQSVAHPFCLLYVQVWRAGSSLGEDPAAEVCGDTGFLYADHGAVRVGELIVDRESAFGGAADGHDDSPVPAPLILTAFLMEVTSHCSSCGCDPTGP